LAISTYLSGKLLDHTFRNTAYSSPATTYVALYVGDPSGAGTEVSTVDTGYVRQSATFSEPSSGVISNSSAIEFPLSTDSWGTITYVAIYDAETDGNLLAYEALTVSRTVYINTQFIYPIGDLEITLD